MKILAIETTTKRLGIAIADDRSILAEYRGGGELTHAQDLIPNIDSLLKDTGSRLVDIDCFAISIGPGSFTGLRVGVATLKGLNLVTGIPIVSIPTLDVIAHNAIDAKLPICVIVDAKKKNLYTSLYNSVDGGIIRLWDYLLVSMDDLLEKLKDYKEVLFLGDGIDLYGDSLIKHLGSARLARSRWYPDAKVVAALAREKFKKREFQDPDVILPMYIYSQECSIRGINK